MLAALVRGSDHAVRLLALLGSIGLIAMMLHVGLDVLLRAVVGRPIPATVEIVSRYYMVLIAFLPLAWVERRQAMVSVEVFETLMPAWMLRLSDVLVALLSCCLYAVLAYVTWKTALSNLSTRSFVLTLNIAVPVWPSHFLPPVGFSLAALATAVRVAERLLAPSAPTLVTPEAER